MNAKQKLCKAASAGGKPCRAKAIRGDYCFAHSPELADKRNEARKLGGENKSKAKRLAKLNSDRLSPVLEKLGKSLEEVYDGKREPKTATAMASLANAITRVLSSGELELRVRDLERKYQVEGNYDPIE